MRLNFTFHSFEYESANEFRHPKKGEFYLGMQGEVRQADFDMLHPAHILNKRISWPYNDGTYRSADEVRAPKKGEFYLSTLNKPTEATKDFHEDCTFLILEKIPNMQMIPSDDYCYFKIDANGTRVTDFYREPYMLNSFDGTLCQFNFCPPSEDY